MTVNLIISGIIWAESIAPNGLMLSDRQTGPPIWPDRRQCGGNLTSNALIGKALKATLIGGFEVEWDSA